MHLSTFLIAATTTFLSLVSAGQVDFYSDTNCQNYIGSAFPGQYQTTGGPAGSFSAKWISADLDPCFRQCGSKIICGDSKCSRRKAVGIGGCASFNTGVWARNGCGGDMCGNA